MPETPSPETDRLHDNHAALQPHVESLRTVADAVGTAPAEALRRLVGAALAVILTEVLPHAGAEEDVIYPAIQRAMGSPRATVGMEHDHTQVRLLTHEIREIDHLLRDTTSVSDELASRIRRVFYGLYAILILHFEKEEHIYLPHLRQRLSDAALHQLVERMEAAIQLHKAALAPA